MVMPMMSEQVWADLIARLKELPADERYGILSLVTDYLSIRDRGKRILIETFCGRIAMRSAAKVRG